MLSGADVGSGGAVGNDGRDYSEEDFVFDGFFGDGEDSPLVI